MVHFDPSRLPSPRDPDFGPRIRRLDAALANPEREFRAVLADGKASSNQRFAALYGVLHRLRREYRYREYSDLLREYEEEFGQEPYFETFRVVLARWTGDDARGIRRALEASERAVSLLPQDPGVLHQYSELVATLGELDEDSAKRYLDKAVDRVDKAIDMAPTWNAVYYATRARLHLLSRQLDSARSDIEHALSSENADAADYTRRISRYESIRLLIMMRQQQEQLDSKQRAVLVELDQFKAQQLALLSLLAALIALLAVTASIATRVNPTDAIRLILVAGGVTTIIFGAVAGVLIGTAMRRISLVLGTGIALILCGVLINLHPS